MIIIDLSQIILSNMFRSSNDGLTFEENIVRPMILNSLRAYNKKFSEDYGELVIAADGPSFWRKSVYPYYKANRKRDRAESTTDWKSIFEILNKIRDEIKDNLPYRVVRAEGAEADDVIGVLVAANSMEGINNNNRILVISGDHDFVQLQKYPNVKQYDPVKKKYILNNDPHSFLREHIIRGDTGDGIPNVLSTDDTLVMGKRQTTMTAKRFEALMTADPTDAEIARNFKRNELLIDLTKIPNDVHARVKESFQSEAGKGKEKILKYIIAHRMSNLLDVIGDF